MSELVAAESVKIVQNIYFASFYNILKFVITGRREASIIFYHHAFKIIFLIEPYCKLRLKI